MKTRRYQDPLRKIARSLKYQHLYSFAQNLTSMGFFENVSDFSEIQLEFLYWVALYNRLYHDLACGEKYLTEEVIEDDLLCDCYLIWEHKVKQKEDFNRSRNPRNQKQIDRTRLVPSVIFRKG